MERLEESSASVSFDKVPLPEFTVKVLSSFTAPVSFTPTGSSSTPRTVIVKVAVSVPSFPSLTVKVNVSVAVSPASNASAAS